MANTQHAQIIGTLTLDPVGSKVGNTGTRSITAQLMTLSSEQPCFMRVTKSTHLKSRGLLQQLLPQYVLARLLRGLPQDA